LYRSSEIIASARARWLAELAAALEEAQRFATLLGNEQPESDELGIIRARIKAVRAELESLRRAGLGELRREVNPEWTNLAKWRGNLVEQPKL